MTDQNIKELNYIPSTPDSDAKWIDEKRERDIQRKKQRGILFWCLLITSVVFYIVFLLFLICPTKTDNLPGISPDMPYGIWLISLLALVPTVLLISLMRAVYRSTKDNGTGASNVATELAKLVTLLVRQFSTK